jgi:alpha-beta hydrolase superfamily lysophospholipase
MNTDHTFFTGSDGTPLFLHRWFPAEKPCAVIQIVHGMAEHAARYERLAQFLTDRGMAVYADDHRGHGLSVADGKSWGILADKDGFTKMVEDEKGITDRIRQEYPGIPVLLLGHSMGSFISRCYAAKYGGAIEGLILSGTGSHRYPELYVGLTIAELQKLFQGKKHPSKLLDKLAFGGYNQKFAPNQTSFDWLSRDEKEVDLYLADPMCGNIFPNGFYAEFFRALLYLKRQKSVDAIPTNLPVYVYSGDKDPVGSFGKGVTNVWKRYERHGIKNLEMQLFQGGRHEMLNETNREEVMQKLYDWIRKTME